MNNNTIGVIGIGRLGLSFALLAEKCGYVVNGCDSRLDYIKSIAEGTYTTSEPYIIEYLKESKNFHMYNKLLAVVTTCDVLFCFVATPSLSDGSYDHSAIERVVADIQSLHVRGMDMTGKTLVIGCTTMPGHCDIVAGMLEHCGMKVAYNPEFIAQGDIINGLRTADMVLIGTDDEPSYHALQGIYRTIMTKEPKFSKMSRKAAEITKISINCFLTMKIAYANMIGEIAINSGIENEVSTILSAIGSDSRIGNKFLSYGFGYGGPCLPRDMKALGIHSHRVCVKNTIPITIDGSNRLHGIYLANYFILRNPDKTIPFQFTQLSYKKGVDMLVESQQYQLCKHLLSAGYSVVIDESENVIAQIQEELSEYEDRVIYGTVDNAYKITI